jgi:uncharacterized protein YukE
MGERVQVNSFSGLHDAGHGFIAAANRMEQRLEDLMKRINAMDWDSDSRQAFDSIQRRFNSAYLDLKQILADLGSNVDGIATRHEQLEGYLSKNVWGGGH